MLTVKLEDRELRLYISKLYSRSKDLRPILTSFIGDIHSNIMANFRNEGSHGDILSGDMSASFKKWEPLSEWTKAGKPNGSILQASNNLRMSIGSVKNIKKFSLEYGTNLKPHAALMHFGSKGLPGGVLTPKKSKFLALPFPNITGNPRDYKNTFFRRSSAGALILYQKQGLDTIPLFLMKKEVHIPARPYVTLSPKTLDILAEKTAWALTHV